METTGLTDSLETSVSVDDTIRSAVNVAEISDASIRYSGNESSAEVKDDDNELIKLLDDFSNHLGTPQYIFSVIPNKLTSEAKISGTRQVIRLFSIRRLSQLYDLEFIRNIPHDERLLRTVRIGSEKIVSESTTSNRLQSFAEFLTFCQSRIDCFTQAQIDILKTCCESIEAAAKAAFLCKANACKRAQHRPVTEDLTSYQAKSFYKYVWEQKCLILVGDSEYIYFHLFIMEN